MIEKYYKYKIEYNNYIVFIKVGIFYECINKDALIINNIFKYKLKKISNILRTGFPLNSINNVISTLKNNNINYITIDNDIITDKYESEKNNYNNYQYNIDNILFKIYKKDKIIKILEENIIDFKTDEKLDKIIELLNK